MIKISYGKILMKETKKTLELQRLLDEKSIASCQRK